MANLKMSALLRNNMLDEVTTAVGTSGLILIYSGAQPGGGGSPVGTLLGTLTCATTFAPSASGGQLTISSITSDTSADATGTASFFRLTKSDTTWVLDGDITVTGGGGDMTLDSISIVLNGTIAITSGTITAPNAA